MDDLVGVAEVAEMLGITRQGVHNIAHSDPAFPEPRARLSAGLIWNRIDVEQWIKTTGRSAEPNG